MAASAELLQTFTAPFPKQAHEPVVFAGVSDPDSLLDGSYACGCLEAPLTSEAPLADAAPLTSEPPLSELPLTSEPAGAGYDAEFPDI